MTKKENKQLIVLVILFLITFYYAYKYNNKLLPIIGDADADDGLLTEEECWARPFIECWSGCNPSWRPYPSSPENSMFHALACGVQDEC